MVLVTIIATEATIEPVGLRSNSHLNCHWNCQITLPLPLKAIAGIHLGATHYEKVTLHFGGIE